MARFREKEPIYDVASAFKSLCLNQDKSLLWPEKNVWTVENLNSLKESLIDNPDEGKGTFLEKLEEQLDNQSLDVHRLATEILGFYHLFHDTARSQTKLGQIQEIINWKLSDDQSDLSDLQKAHDVLGVGNPGIYFLTARYDVIGYFLKTFIELKAKIVDAEDDLSVKEIADLVESHHPRNATGSRNVLMHLLFPDKYERSTKGFEPNLMKLG